MVIELDVSPDLPGQALMENPVEAVLLAQLVRRGLARIRTANQILATIGHFAGDRSMRAPCNRRHERWGQDTCTRPLLQTPSSSARDRWSRCTIVIAQTGRKLVVFEAEPTIGGRCLGRAERPTLPGFVHDICSAVPSVRRRLALPSNFATCTYGLERIEPSVYAAGPVRSMDLRGGRAVAGETHAVERLGGDGDAYLKL